MGDFSSLPFSLDCKVLPCSGLDHYPLLLSLQGESSVSKPPFRFENMWMKDPNFLALIEQWWNEGSFEGSRLFCFVSKLKFIKRNLLEWNADHFRNIFVTKRELEAQLEDLNEKVITEGMSQAEYLKERELLADYEDILSKEEVFWKQKSREIWLQVGDKNNKFFHNVTKQRRNLNRITKLETQGNQMVGDPQIIRNEIIQFYSNLLNNLDGSDLKEQRNFLSVIPKEKTDEQNKTLNESFSYEEVSKALLELPSDKASGPDGFSTGFFKKCWHIIGAYLVAALESTRR